MNTDTKQFRLRNLTLIVVIAALLFGGIGITVAAAQASIPGDALYPVKSSLEQTRLSLAQDAGDRAQMRMGFAEQRLKEIAALVEEGRYQEVGEAVLAFEADIHSAILELEIISQIDPARGTQIALAITEALTRYAQTLSAMIANAPQSVKTDVTRALDTTQIASGLELSPAGLGSDDNSNDNDSNFNDNANTNGDDDNANANGDDDNANNNGDDGNNNDNGDDSSNGNSNANDDSGNDNGDDSDGGNSNDNGDDSSNGNSNANDDSGNDNGDDSSNGNSNANDDSGNDNGDASGGGGNDNGDDSSNGNSNANDDSGNDNGDDSGGDGSNDNSNNSGSGGGGGNDND